MTDLLISIVGFMAIYSALIFTGTVDEPKITEVWNFYDLDEDTQNMYIVLLIVISIYITGLYFYYHAE